MDELELELKRGFLEEATQLLDEAEQLFLSIQETGGDDDSLNGMFRLAHNLKGTSQAVGFSEIGEFTHKLENIILMLKNRQLTVTDHVISVLLACTDRVRLMVEGLSADLTAHFDNADLVAQLVALGNGEGQGASAPAAPAPVPVVESAQVEEVADFSAPPSADLFPEEEAPVGDQFEVHEAPAKAAPQAYKEPVKDNKDPVKLKIEESIRVSLDRLDKLNNLVGELVILESMIRSSAISQLDSESIKSITQLGKLSKDIQEVTMSLRMISIKPTLKKMQRVVRDVSLALNKKVNLTFIGEETEVDKTVLENLTDPLTHIVRNAVDHGIENPDDRKNSSKSDVSELIIRCAHEGNNLVIEVIDDGKGIDPEKIRGKAIEKGILRADQEISRDQLIRLIFHPGFSTKTEVSEISGRGVGMDVVKTNIEGMSGRVQVNTEVGKGSTFRVELPLTMAVIDGMVVCHAGHRYVVPLNQVHETIQPTKEVIHSITGMGEIMLVRGEKISVCRLNEAFGLKSKDKAAENHTAIIVRSPRGSLAVFVDEIVGRQQVVIKNIDENLNRKNLFIGSSILGDGMPSLIVDLHQIIESSSSRKEALSA